jgi:hypothetical protein
LRRDPARNGAVGLAQRGTEVCRKPRMLSVSVRFLQESEDAR